MYSKFENFCKLKEIKGSRLIVLMSVHIHKTVMAKSVLLYLV